MKTWMLLVVSSSIGGTWGPLPYDMDECLRRADDENAVMRGNMAARGPGELKLSPANTFLVCLRAPVRPTLREEQNDDR